MDTFKNDLIKLGSTNPELRPHIRHLLAGCDKLPEGGMRDNCEKKKEESGKEASDWQQDLIRLGSTNPELRPHIREILKASGMPKSASYINRLPMQFHAKADRLLDALFVVKDPADRRELVFATCVYLLSLMAPEQATMVDRLLARFRRAPMGDTETKPGLLDRLMGRSHHEPKEDQFDFMS